MELSGALAVASGLDSNTENGGVLDPPSGAAMELVEWLAVRALPASVLLSEPADAETRARLIALGLEPENSGNEMGARLDDLRLPAADPAGLELGEVPASKATWTAS